MDPALKNRLIGASVLIVLAIIFLPMLFDGKSGAESDLTRIDIADAPARDFETRVVPLDLPSAPGGVAAAAGVDEIADVNADVNQPAVAAANTDPITALPTEAAPIETLATVTAASSKPADAMPETMQPAAASASATRPVAPAAGAADNPKPDAVAAAEPTTSRSGRFVVNLGSYANADNARELGALLGKSGLHPGSEVLERNGARVTRLRLGPYATRGQAESVRLKVRAVRADVPASISEIDDSPAGDVGSGKPPRAISGAYAVQVAVLSDAGRANQQRDQLRGAGFAAFVEKLNTANGAVFRVRVGPEASRDNALKLKSGIKQRFGLDAIVVDYP